MEGLRYESYSGNVDVCSERTKGRTVLTLMEVFMVVYGLSRTSKSFIVGCRSCGGCVMTVSVPYYVVVTCGEC